MRMQSIADLPSDPSAMNSWNAPVQDVCIWSPGAKRFVVLISIQFHWFIQVSAIVYILTLCVMLSLYLWPFCMVEIPLLCFDTHTLHKGKLSDTFGGFLKHVKKVTFSLCAGSSLPKQTCPIHLYAMLGEKSIRKSFWKVTAVGRATTLDIHVHE